MGGQHSRRSLAEIDLNLTLNSENDSSAAVTTSVLCANTAPAIAQLFSVLPMEGFIIIGVLSIFTILTLVIYIEQAWFTLKHFHTVTKTLWLLACYPVFSVAGLLGVAIPRAGPLTDLMSNAFFATCLYNFGALMVAYMGGSKLMWKVLEPGRKVRLTAPPCGCFCCCVAPVEFNRPVFRRMRCLILQVAIVRPLLMFLAVVLWTDGSYQPGNYQTTSAYTYIVLANVISTMLAVYGLMLFKNTFYPELGSKFRLSGKILCIQLTLLLSILPNVIIGLLVRLGIIGCGPLLPPRARGDVLYHGCLVIMMLPLSLLAQKFFRRHQDAWDCGRELKQQTDWLETLSRVDAKGWLSLGETVI